MLLQIFSLSFLLIDNEYIIHFAYSSLINVYELNENEVTLMTNTSIIHNCHTLNCTVFSDSYQLISNL